MWKFFLAAAQMLTKSNKIDSLFLIRTNEKFRGYCDSVLLFCLKGKVYNYQIKSRADRWLYIDDGPLFDTLPHLVDHYIKHSDGLPTILKEAIPSSLPPVPPEYPGISLNLHHLIQARHRLQCHQQEQQTVILEPQILMTNEIALINLHLNLIKLHQDL